MYGAMKEHLAQQLEQIRGEGLYKNERVITSPQAARITVRGGKRVPPEKEGAVHMIGMLLLLGLIFYIAFGDISRIINGESIFP